MTNTNENPKETETQKLNQEAQDRIWAQGASIDTLQNTIGDALHLIQSTVTLPRAALGELIHRARLGAAAAKDYALANLQADELRCTNARVEGMYNELSEKYENLKELKNSACAQLAEAQSMNLGQARALKELEQRLLDNAHLQEAIDADRREWAQKLSDAQRQLADKEKELAALRGRTIMAERIAQKASNMLDEITAPLLERQAEELNRRQDAYHEGQTTIFDLEGV